MKIRMLFDVDERVRRALAQRVGASGLADRETVISFIEMTVDYAITEATDEMDKNEAGVRTPTEI